MVAHKPPVDLGICAPGLSVAGMRVEMRVEMRAEMRVGSAGNYNAIFMIYRQMLV
ncbi:hypothetical protein [Pandoraea cepalis]|uniref:Uncharacterized protein n=1 Tax=Pandoraea cepalis TaxID=2508294 RepID=A0A5E4WQK8_9BURK|nr:hypothetical protein [Pandoraea cepalis]VVE25970.1 hypothetical protein PCE31107_03399 [Pandoraea cepalis]